MDADKVDVVWSWLLPCTVHAVHKFLGRTNYYCMFIHSYNEIAALPTRLLTCDAFS
jgi:hypothetical protein